MGPFELAFSWFGVLLALCLAQVLGGFAKAVKRTPGYRMGLLTPLLSLFLLYDIATFWINAWAMQTLLPTQIGTLVVGVVITGLYYFAAVLVWPDDGDPAWSDLDAWMLRHKRKVLLSMLVANAVNLGGIALLVPGPLPFTNVQYVLIMLYFVGLVAGSIARGRKQTLAALVVLVGLYVGDLYVNVIGT
jgi:hypothetical protein